MKAFLQRFGLLVAGVLQGFDRPVFKGKLVLARSSRQDRRRLDGLHARYAGQPKGVSADGRQKPDIGFPILRFLVIFSLAVGTVLDAAFCPYQGKATSELALFRSLHDSLDEGDVATLQTLNAFALPLLTCPKNAFGGGPRSDPAGHCSPHGRQPPGPIGAPLS
jgi:hypothetical protein